MVSIPDWARLSRFFGDGQKESLNQLSKYTKQREAAIIKDAEEQGYFLQASKSFLGGQFIDRHKHMIRHKSILDDDETVDLNQVPFIKLTCARLRNLGEISMCHSLRICILSNNYITKIDGLEACISLEKLDLSGNQISRLPDQSFWCDMWSLSILHLHDNPIGRIENLHFLGASPNLIALTAYDTPLSLKRNYRHHVVNSIWTLKALDCYVISDEEIIEDSSFGGRFSSMHPTFFIKLYNPLPQESTYEEERFVMLDTISRINQILAHNSPVVVVQRYVRGFMVRRHMKFILDTRIWAAVTIQRRFRRWKGIPHPERSVTMPSIPPSHEPPGPPPGTMDSLKMDYDTYLKLRRPGSAGLSEVSGVSTAKGKMEIEDRGTISAPPATPVSSEKSEGHKKCNLYINLAKLQASTMQSIQDDTFAYESVLPTERSDLEPSRPKRAILRTKLPKAPERKRKVIKSVKQFFGPVVETCSSPNIEETDDEVPWIKFRLRGYKHNIRITDPVRDLIIANREAGKDIRAAENMYHLKRELQPKPNVLKHQFPNTNQRIYARVQGTMGLSCLRSVQQAYKDREKAEKNAVKAEYVMTLKEQRDIAKERMKMFHEERRNNAIRERDRDHCKIMEVLEKRELRRITYLEKTQEIRAKSSHIQKKRRGELTFVSDFQAQNTSVSKALLRHDRQTKTEEVSGKVTNLVESHKRMEKDQQEIVRKYLEHRKMMRQTESAMSRAALDTRMLQEANDRLLEAKNRVAQQKARSAQVCEYCHVGDAAAKFIPPLEEPDSQKVEMKGMDSWNTSVTINAGRVGKHHTMVSV